MEDEKSARKMVWEAEERKAKDSKLREDSPVRNFQDMLVDRHDDAFRHIFIEKGIKEGKISSKEEFMALVEEEKEELYGDEKLNEFASKRINDIKEAMQKIARKDSSELMDSAAWRIRNLSRPERLLAAVSLADSRIGSLNVDSTSISEFLASQKRSLTTQLDEYFKQEIEDPNSPNNEQE